MIQAAQKQLQERAKKEKNPDLLTSKDIFSMFRRKIHADRSDGSKMLKLESAEQIKDFIEDYKKKTQKQMGDNFYVILQRINDVLDNDLDFQAML